MNMDTNKAVARAYVAWSEAHAATARAREAQSLSTYDHSTEGQFDLYLAAMRHERLMALAWADAARGAATETETR